MITETMTRSQRTLLLLVMSCMIAAGQEARAQVGSPISAKAPEFDVVSIKPSGPKSSRGWGGGPGSESPTLFHYRTATLQDLIEKAWNVDSFQVSSSTSLGKETFDLEARLPDGATKEDLRSMLQTALKTRFALKAHLESREFPAYEVVESRSGLKLKEAVEGVPGAPQGANSGGPCGQIGWPDVPLNLLTVSFKVTFMKGYRLNCFTVQRESFATLAHLLRRVEELPVVDKTGRTAKYSFHLEYAEQMPDANADTAFVASDVFTALKEQLGLQLQKRRLPFDVVVVESFNKLPTEN